MDGLTVAVTGPTGEIGIAALRALDASPRSAASIGMARRPFDPAAHGLSEKVVYQQGDVLDRDSVDALVAGADVVVHLAFIIFGDPDEAQRINTEGSRNVFEATVAAGAKRLVYTSSVAAYGFHEDNPQPLTEDVPPRGSDASTTRRTRPSSSASSTRCLAGSDTDAYVFRPCIVAGAGAPMLIETMVGTLPIYGQLRLARRIARHDPVPRRRSSPTPGSTFQLVHTNDVAAALLAAVEGRGEPGRYNLAGPGALTVGRMARALGWHSVPVPDVAVASLDELLRRLPGHARRGRLADRIQGADADGLHAGAREARLGAAPRRCRYAGGDGSRRARAGRGLGPRSRPPGSPGGRASIGDWRSGDG